MVVSATEKTFAKGNLEHVRSKGDEGVLRGVAQAGVRPRSAAGADVREGGSEVRNPRPARGRALPRLRGYTEAGGEIPRVLLPESRLRLPHTATARRHGVRERHPARRQESLRHHGRRKEVPG